MDTDGVLEMWQQSMRASGRSQRTISERLRIMAASGLDVQHAQVHDLEAWLAQPQWAQSTRRAYRECLRACFTFVHARGLRPDNPADMLPAVRVPRSRPHPISTEQLSLLLARARTRRLRGYLLLGAYAGLRVSEVARVRGDDVELDAGLLTVAGKGGVVARLPLHPVLQEYALDMPATGWWFPSGTGHVTGKNVSVVVSAHMRRCGVPGTAHALRHWLGTELVAAGVQMRVVQDSLRHANLQTTQIYTRVDDAQLRCALTGLPHAA